MKYKIKESDIPTLKDKGFKYNNLDKENPYYYNYIPVLKYKRTTVLNGKITIYENGEVKLDCFQQNNIIYPPFYNREYGNYEFVLNEIYNNFYDAFKKYNITKKGRNSNDHKYIKVRKKM